MKKPSARLLSARVTADIEGEFVVFLIGMHINRLRAVRQWSTAGAAMTRMLRELRVHLELGLLHAEGGWLFGGPAVVEYWRSYEHLDAHARAADAAHLPAWRAYNRLARTSDAVGIWHETYHVTPGSSEVVYNNMPEVGLLAAGGPRPLRRGSTSALRIGARAQDEAPVQAP